MENCSKIRIAQVLGSVAEGGVETLVMNYYRNIDREKIQFDFFVENPSKIIRSDLIEAMGGRIIYIPKIEKLIFNQRKLVKLLKEGDYDIVHAQKTTLNYFYLKAAKKAGVRIRISHAHSTSNKKEWKKNFLKNLLRPFSKKYATHYFACSEMAGRWMFGNKLYDAGKVIKISDAIELDRFYFNEIIRESMRKQLEIDDKFVIGNVGRFIPQKNQYFLLNVFYRFQLEHKNSILLLVGDGPLYEKLAEKSKNLGISHKVIFAGTHKHPERYYQAMDCFVFPSLYEGLGMALIEAQINGLPCLCSKNVPLEAKVAENVEFLNLNDSIDKWCKCIKDDFHRENNQLLFDGSKWDIKYVSSKLEKIYFRLVKESKKI